MIGLFARNGWIRGGCWLLFLPLAWYSFDILINGAALFFVEPLAPTEYHILAALTAWPVLGCVIGEFIKHWPEMRRPR